MLFRISPLSRRSATVAPLAALLMTFLTGMLAFSIDIGYICYVQGELQDAADAAALAGAEQMQNFFVAFYSPGADQQSIYSTVTTNTSSSSSPIPTAQQYAYYNQAGGVNVKVPPPDISFSYYNGSTFSSPSLTYFPNTVTVITRRDNTGGPVWTNGPLGLFFGQIFGISNVSLTATASATIYNGVMTGMTSTPPYTTSGTSSSTTPTITINSSALPVALDINVWGNYASGNFVFTSGEFVSSPSPYLTSNNITAGSNGLPQLQVYPSNTNTPGNFGLIDLGPPATNAPAFRNWIDDGVTANDISYLTSNNLLPVSLSDPANWTVGPGLKNTLLSNFQSVMGLPNLIPLFQPYQAYNPLLTPPYIAANSQGSNATYAVVGFAGVTISEADGNGAPGMTIAIQPSAIVSPTAIIPNPLPAATFTQQSSFSAWSSSQTASTLTSWFGPASTTFVPAKLTQ
jgi:hypothetical protein